MDQQSENWTSREREQEQKRCRHRSPYHRPIYIYLPAECLATSLASHLNQPTCYKPRHAHIYVCGKVEFVFKKWPRQLPQVVVISNWWLQQVIAACLPLCAGVPVMSLATKKSTETTSWPFLLHHNHFACKYLESYLTLIRQFQLYTFLNFIRLDTIREAETAIQSTYIRSDWVCATSHNMIAKGSRKQTSSK